MTKLTFSPAHLLACKGFSLLEVVICVVILGFFITIVAMNTGKFNEDIKIAAALKDMKAIQTAIINGLYSDLGYIPCGIEAADKDDYERKEIEGLFVPAYLFLERAELKETLAFPECVKKTAEKEEYMDEWDKYISKGWRGPYMKGAVGSLDATYFDEGAFPKDSEGRRVYLPVLLTPWAERCEEMAREAEQKGRPDLARGYRKGKYYHIFYPQVTFTRPEYGFEERLGMDPFIFFGWQEPLSCEIPRYGAYIVCRGADCLAPEAQYVDVATYLRCEAKIKEDAVRVCLPEKTTVEGLKACVKEIYENEYPGCYTNDKDPVSLETRLCIVDPENEYYMDIDDDLVMSLFGAVVRSPMDR